MRTTLRYWRHMAALACACCMAACAVPAPPMPAQPWSQTHAEDMVLPQRVLVTQSHPDSAHPPSVWIIVAQNEGTALRWSRFDLLGIPDARQQWQGQDRWENEGFIPPNPQARELFAALWFAWTRTTDLDAHYGVGHWRNVVQADGTQVRELREQGHTLWRVRWSDRATPAVFSIQHQDGTVWDVRPLSAPSP